MTLTCMNTRTGGNSTKHEAAGLCHSLRQFQAQRQVSCDGRHATAAQGREGFESSLNACTATTVGARNGQYSGVMRRTRDGLIKGGDRTKVENYEAWA